MDVEFRIMIRFEGLTEHQIMLLDIIWEKDTAPELYEWMESLTPDNLREVTTLTGLIQWAYIDAEVNTTTDTSDAYRMIMDCQHKQQ